MEVLLWAKPVLDATRTVVTLTKSVIKRLTFLLQEGN